MLPVLLCQIQGGTLMSREQAIIHYLTAIASFRKWLEKGVITDREFQEIESLAANRYELPQSSIYR